MPRSSTDKHRRTNQRRGQAITELAFSLVIMVIFIMVVGHFAIRMNSFELQKLFALRSQILNNYFTRLDLQSLLPFSPEAMAPNNPVPRLNRIRVQSLTLGGGGKVGPYDFIRPGVELSYDLMFFPSAASPDTGTSMVRYFGSPFSHAGGMFRNIRNMDGLFSFPQYRLDYIRKIEELSREEARILLRDWSSNNNMY